MLILIQFELSPSYPSIRLLRTVIITQIIDIFHTCHILQIKYDFLVLPEYDELNDNIYNLNMIRLILLGYLFIIIYSKLWLVSDDPSCKELENKNIQYTMANFGHNPFGRTLYGFVGVTSETNSELCTPDLDQTMMYVADADNFLIIRRGNCKFTLKAKNAEELGYSLAIIYNNNPDNSDMIMVNDGFGHLVDIPSIFISQEDGQYILDKYKKCDSLMIKIKFDVLQKEKANLTLWLDPNNRESFITIRDFYNNYYHVIKNSINLEVRFRLSKGCYRETCPKDTCIVNDDKYCLRISKELDEAGHKLSGSSVIRENLRSYYLLQYAKELQMEEIWWRYMIEFDDNICMRALDLRGCSKEVMDEINPTMFDIIDEKVENAIKSAKSNQQNPLEMFLRDIQKQDIIFYPQATVNSRNYYGLFKATDIFNMVCNSIFDPPSQCYDFGGGEIIIDPYYPDQSGLWVTIFSIIGCMLIIFIIAILCYTKVIRKQMGLEMNARVNAEMERYSTMSESKEVVR